MSNPNEHGSDSFGRQLLDQLSEQLAKAKRARKAQLGEHQQSGGFVHNLQDAIHTDHLNEKVTRGNKFTPQELQLLLLTLLVDKPAHGFELINSLATLSNGCCSPSPGVIYPSLTHLDELGHITVTTKEKRKSYVLSDVGRQFLTYHQERVDLTWLKLTNLKCGVDNMGITYTDTCEISDDVALESNAVGTYLPELIRARHTLRNAIAQCSNASTQEQRRIADILIQAARDVLGK